MLKAFRLGIIIGILLALFAAILAVPLHFDIVLPQNSDIESFLADEGAVRSERSANISHIIGISRKIQLIVNKIMFLQIYSDGSVNGTDNDNEYTILQRASINNYQIKIQGVMTCNFLCMDRCGLLYGSKEFTDECIFNEMMESHHFNTYSSAKYSNDKRTLYLALNKKGIPRKVQTKAKASLGKLETYTNVLTKPVPVERVEALAIKITKARILLGKFLLGSGEEGFSNNHVFRHHRYQFCPNTPMTMLDEKNKFRCRKKEKRKKKRKCKDDEYDDDECFITIKKKSQGKCDEDEDEEDCQIKFHGVRQKRKSRIGSDSDLVKALNIKSMDGKEKKRKKRLKPEKKFSDRTIKVKCDSELNCGKKKGGIKGYRKTNVKSSTLEAKTTTSLWKDNIEDKIDMKSTEVVERVAESTEKSLEDYEEEYQTEKFIEDEGDMSVEFGYDWTTQPTSYSFTQE